MTAGSPSPSAAQSSGVNLSNGAIVRRSFITAGGSSSRKTSSARLAEERSTFEHSTPRAILPGSQAAPSRACARHRAERQPATRRSRHGGQRRCRRDPGDVEQKRLHFFGVKGKRRAVDPNGLPLTLEAFSRKHGQLFPEASTRSKDQPRLTCATLRGGVPIRFRAKLVDIGRRRRRTISLVSIASRTWPNEAARPCASARKA